MSRSSRFSQLVCLVLAAGVLVGGVRPAHRWLLGERGRAIPAGESVGPMGELDSFALGLLLGGFRGPLVMYLWVTSEEEKNEDDISRILTRSELISELQPNFVSVYLYQSWNLAYNISVKYNRRSEKYRWVMEGIKFIEKGERRVPNDTDIVSELGHLYFDKLGSASEADFYREQFRRDSLDQRLDESHRLKPEFARRWQYIDRMDGLIERIRAEAAGGKWADPPAPAPADAPRHAWPYGVSVYAVAYDYYKQARSLQPTKPHRQFGESVIHSRPAIACRAWVDEEMALGLLAEGRIWPGLDRGGPIGPLALSDRTAGLLDEAVFHYREAGRVADLARSAYHSHMRIYRESRDNFDAHVADVDIKAMLARAGEGRLAGLRGLAEASDPAAQAPARSRLAEARIDYEEVRRRIADHVATQYRPDPMTGEDWFQSHREKFNRLADHAARCIDQIDAAIGR